MMRPGEAVAAIFRQQEDTAGYLLLLREMVTARGIPAAIYRDGHSIFHSPGTEVLDIDQQLLSTSDQQPIQVGRVQAELGIESMPLLHDRPRHTSKLLAHPPGPSRRRA